MEIQHLSLNRSTKRVKTFFLSWNQNELCERIEQTSMQSRQKLTKWGERTRVGINLCQLPSHAHSVPLVCLCCVIKSIKQPDANHFIQAMEEDIKALEDNDHWEIVSREDIPSQYACFTCKFVHEEKAVHRHAQSLQV